MLYRIVATNQMPFIFRENFTKIQNNHILLFFTVSQNHAKMYKANVYTFCQSPIDAISSWQDEFSSFKMSEIFRIPDLLQIDALIDNSVIV